MDKVIKDGQVAVAVSYGFGAGWSTWNEVHPCDARFNTLFLEGKNTEAAELCRELGLGYSGGAADVRIVWIDLGTHFRISEYDGSESLKTRDGESWLVA